MNSRRIKIIKTLAFRDLREKGFFNELHLPPLALGVIVSHLKSKGYAIDQDDLNVMIKGNQLSDRDTLNKFNLIRALDLDKKEIVFQYLKNGENSRFDLILSKLLSKTSVEGVDVLLLSCFPTDPRSSLLTLCIAKFIKDRKDKILIVIGGEHHAQQFGSGRHALIKDNIDMILDLGTIDYYVSGPGEVSLDYLLQAIAGNKDLSGVPGLIYRTKDSLTLWNDKIIPKIVTPDFEGLPLEKYVWRPSSILLRRIPHSVEELESGVLMVPLQFMVGCPNKCAFCELSHPGLKLRIQHPQDTVKNLKHLSSKYRTKYFFFLNSCINVSKKYINELCNEILRSGLNILWSDCARVNNLDKETVLKMREAGAVRLIFGLETASERMLRYLGKRITLAEVQNALMWCREAGIWTCLELISGLPYESEEDIDSTIKFLEQNRENLDDVFLNAFFLEPNSVMALFPDKYGLKNIRRIELGKMKYFHSPAYNLAFDEIHGLSWAAKEEQQWQSYTKIRLTLTKLGLNAPDYVETLHVLFYLYSHYSEKGTIKSIYHGYFEQIDSIRQANIEKKRKMERWRNLMIRPYLIPLKLLRIRSFGELARLMRGV